MLYAGSNVQLNISTPEKSLSIILYLKNLTSSLTYIQAFIVSFRPVYIKYLFLWPQYNLVMLPCSPLPYTIPGRTIVSSLVSSSACHIIWIFSAVSLLIPYGVLGIGIVSSVFNSSAAPYGAIELVNKIFFIPYLSANAVTFSAPSILVSKYASSGWPGVLCTAARLNIISSSVGLKSNVISFLTSSLIYSTPSIFSTTPGTTPSSPGITMSRSYILSFSFRHSCFINLIRCVPINPDPPKIK